MNTSENNENIESFLGDLRKQALLGNFGSNAIWNESKKAERAIARYREETGTSPEFIEIIQALVLFAANQPDLKFLIPYLGEEKSYRELDLAFKSMLKDEIEELGLYNNLHEANIAFYNYEMNRNKKFQARLIDDSNRQKWIGE
jgi:hypothetical protein